MGTLTQSKRTGLLLVFAVLLAGLLIGLMLLLTGSQAARANPGVIHVDAAATGAATGVSWTDAFTNVQDALGDGDPGDEIWVAAGVYYPDEGTGQTDGDRESTFTLQPGVALYGGFDGTEDTRDERNWTANITVLSGDIDGDDGTDANGVVTDTAYITGTNAYHVVTGGGVTETAVLDGFTITAGSADGAESARGWDGGVLNNDQNPTPADIIPGINNADGNGGGMVNDNSSPTLSHVTFTGNRAEVGGAGMFNDNSSPTLTDVTFSGNDAGYGGGMCNYASNPTLIDVTFGGNHASYGGGIYNYDNSGPALTNVALTDNQANLRGGGMFNDKGSSPTLTQVAFSGNQADDAGGGMLNYDNSSPTLIEITFTGNQAAHGGGVFNDSSNPTLTDVTFSGNQADSGGGLYNWASSPTLTGVAFSGNHADDDGGGVSNIGSTPTLTDVTFSDNDARYGGGMYNSGSSPTLTDVTFGGNHASYGGGIYNYDNSGPALINVALTGNHAELRGGGMFNDKGSSPTLTNVTLSGNQADDAGGGMLNYDNSNPTLVNAILWGNEAFTAGDQIYNEASSTPAVTYSDVQGGCDAIPGNTCGLGNIDADPRFLAPVAASEAPTTTGNYRLRIGSPAVDAGLNAALPGTVTTDLDGNPRKADGNDDGDVVVDMGPFELQPMFTAYLPLLVRNPVGCRNILVNGDFESSEAWLLNNAAYDTETVHQGLRSLRTGALPDEWPSWMESHEQAGESIDPLLTALLADLEGPSVNLQASNFSSARQEIHLPESSDIRLIYWSYPICEGDDTGDFHYVILKDETGVDYWLRADRLDTRTWEQHEHDLSLYAGQVMTLYFGSYNDGDGDTTALFVDDAVLWVCDDGG